MSWARIGVIVSALVAFGALISFAEPILGDPIPLAGIARVDGVQKTLVNTIQNDANRIEARIVGVSILGTWRAACDAQRTNKRDLAQAYSDQLSDLQIEYMRLTGLNYPLRPCL